MAVDARLRALLACPSCRGPLASRGSSELTCPTCSVDYPVVRGIPVLLVPSEARRYHEERARWDQGAIRPGFLSYRTLTRLSAPRLHRWDGEEETVRRLCATAPKGAGLVDIGCGCAGAPGEVWRLDLAPEPGKHVVGDVQALPFADGSLDGLFIFRVLEHVPHPEQSVAELFRVLKPGGFVAAVVPFMEPFHRNPRDHARFSQEGLETLFGAFEKQELRWVAGPTAALAWMLKEYFAICFPFSNRPMVYALARETMGWLLSPLRFLDILLRGKTFAHKIACEFLYIGRKPGTISPGGEPRHG